MKVQNIWRHYCTITKHRRLVRRHCFKIGLYWQGLTHDLSKYSPEEFWTGVRYYQGDRSPNAAEREDVGYSRAWLHHKGSTIMSTGSIFPTTRKMDWWATRCRSGMWLR